MYSTVDSPVWSARWQALKQNMSHILGDTPSRSSFKPLVACLEAFGESQFAFFIDGFRNGRLYPSALFPAEYALRTTLDQVAFDMGVIQQAATQRATSLKPGLDKADQLAQRALTLAIENGLLKETAIITYFNKSPLIRTIPYAPLALVGVPFTSTAVLRDLLATPHEIGHHVYRHSPGLLDDLRNLLPLQPDWCSRWQEEIFADVYGCLVAGPVIGLDFQDILFDHSLEQFMSDDGEHPIEAVRPYAYTKVLRQLGFKHAANALDERWKKMLAARNNPETFIPFGDFGPVSLDEAQQRLEAFALQILDYLMNTRGVKPKDSWSKDLANRAKVEDLYEKFDEWAAALPNETLPELQEDGDEVGVFVNDQLTNKRRKGETQTWIDALKRQENTKLPPEAWEPVLSSEGWTVEGPGTGGWPP